MTYAARRLVEHEASKGAARSNVALLRAILEDAVARTASDVHLDPHEAGIAVRLRRDGLLADTYALPSECHTELVARLKILAGIRIDDHFNPHDGRFTFASHAGAVDIRVATMPTRYGENAVLRLLPRSGRTPSLQALGMSQVHEACLHEAAERTHGLVLVTGPTGSGKSTTLAALLHHVLPRPLSVVTIEDPVEQVLPGATQVEVNAQTGLTFARGLRALLRQDPDVIMVGEIRDAETASLAAHAALTGHLVLATLHATSTAACLPRLRSFGIDAELAEETLCLATAQRLVRRRCAQCAIDSARTRDDCAVCGGSGYAGRVGIFEVRKYAEEDDALFSSLADDAHEKVRAGITTEEEIARICHA